MDPKYQDESMVLMSTEEAAEFLHLKPNTLEVWRTDKRNPGLNFVKVGGNVLYRLSDLRKFLDKNTKGD